MLSGMWTTLTVVFLTIFTIGMLKNLGNIAFWQDEGETMQYARTILKYGYPSVFDGRSFILLDTGDTQYDPKYYFKYWTPYLQSYVAAIPLLFNHGIADTFLIRLPFALFAIVGAWGSWMVFYRLGYPKFALFLYSTLLATSVQLYLYWRQARHYALQFPLALGLVYSYLNLGKRKWNILFIVSGFLFYHAYYPGFIAFYVAITIHAIIRKYLDVKYSLKPLFSCTFMLFVLNFPAYFLLHHYAQRPSSNPLFAFTDYLLELNYFAYFKITALSLIIVILYFLKSEKLTNFKQILNSLLCSHKYSLILFLLIVGIVPSISSFGVQNPRYISIVFPFAFLLAGTSWKKLVELISIKLSISNVGGKIIGLIIFFLLVNISHPGFPSQIKQFYGELNNVYIGPVTGIVNTITGVEKPQQRINAASSLRPDLLIATNFENAALYGYMNNQLLSYFGPADKYKYGIRLPDWVIIRKDWGQEEYLRSFLEKGNYEKIKTDYCDLPYENVYLVRTHNFKTVIDCPDSKLTLYKLIK